MKRILYLIVFAVVTLWAEAYTVEQIPNVHTADKTRYVSNPDGILSATAQAQADSILSAIWQSTTAEVVAVVVSDIDGGDIDNFATELFSLWGIGKNDKDNGVLILIVRDLRKAVIRTGYGAEGVLPDVIAGRIIRDNMAPHFKIGDYDTGTIEALKRLHQIVTTPGAADELMSKYQNDAATEKDDYFKYYLIGCVIITIALLIAFIIALTGGGKKSRHERYLAIDNLNLATLVCVFLGLGLPLVVYLPMLLTKRYLRTSARKCPNCEHKMKRLNEDEDNLYLSAAQDFEEHIDSVDYDVWLCDNCGETDILPYVKKNKSFTVCPACGARACSLVNNRIVSKATEHREGCGVKEYRCANCHSLSQVTYTIPKEVAPVVFIGGGGGSGLGGGGFSGGSFGGGMTGGGGASGGW